MLFSFAVIFAVIILSGVGINMTALLYLPIVMLAELILALGMTFFVSAMNVYFRDLEHIMGIVSMAWMYMTPILYPMDMIPEQMVKLFYLNPMTSITAAYRDILYYKRVPGTDTMLRSIFMGLAVFMIGQAVFCNLQKRFAEEL